MGTTNRERVGKALDLLKAGLRPFVEREMSSVYGDQWVKVAGQSVPRFNLDDVQTLLNVMWNNWNSVFSRTLGQAERSLVSELRELRNRWAHQRAFSTRDAYRAIDSVERLLRAITAKEADEVEMLRMEQLRAMCAPSPLERFMSSLTPRGKLVFQEIFNFCAAPLFRIRWGTKGFSANIKVGGTHVCLFWGFPPHSRYGECIRTCLFRKGGFVSKVDVPEEVVRSAASELLKRGLLRPAGRELKCVIDHDFSKDEIELLLGYLEKMARIAKEHGLKALTKEPD